MARFTQPRGTGGGKTGAGIVNASIQDDQYMCNLDSDDEMDHDLLPGIPLPRYRSNRFVPAPVPRVVPLPPYRTSFDRRKVAAGMEADYRNVAVKYARSWFWRPTRVYPFRRPRPASLAYSMKKISRKVDLGHRKTIEHMQTQPLRIQLFKELCKPRSPPPKFALPESDDEEEEDVEEDVGEEDGEMIVVKVPTATRSSGRTINKPYPTPPATSDDEEEDTNAPTADQQDEHEENEDDDTDEEEDDEEEEEEHKPAPKRRRTGHIEGINRKTGESTLVGRYPGRIDENGNYWCLDEECNRIVKQGNWTTKNGYKYHLTECCLQNPASKRRKEMVAAAEREEEEELKRKVPGMEMEGYHGMIWCRMGNRRVFPQTE